MKTFEDEMFDYLNKCFGSIYAQAIFLWNIFDILHFLLKLQQNDSIMLQNNSIMTSEDLLELVDSTSKEYCNSLLKFEKHHNRFVKKYKKIKRQGRKHRNS